jgi:hypothetical protein
VGVSALGGWEAVNRMAAGIASAYLLLELNTTYSLIRQRTTLPLSTYLLLAAASFCLPLTAGEAWVAPLFLLALHQLFATYESPRAAVGAFNALCCLGVGSFLFPPMAWLLPVWLIGFYQMRALTPRSFLGGLIGFIAPWWCYYGYAFSLRPEWFTPDRVEALYRLVPVDYAAVPAAHLLLWGVLALASLVSILHYVMVSYMDKVRTRVHLSYMVFLQLLLYVAAALQPAHEQVFATLQVPLSAVLVSHLFMLTRTRIVSYYFLVLFLLFLVLPVVCIWIV